MPSGTQSTRVTMPPSNLGARPSTATAWHCVGSPTCGRAAIQQRAQQQALVVGRAAHDEVVRHVAPVLLQPGDVRLESAGGGDQSVGLTSYTAPFSATLAEMNRPFSIARSRASES